MHAPPSQTQNEDAEEMSHTAERYNRTLSKTMRPGAVLKIR